MSKNLEIEVKSVLSKESYDFLVISLNLKPYLQVNYYLDNNKKDIRNQKDRGLRIRQKDNEIELTMKIDQKEGKLEVNQLLSEKEFKEFKDHHFPKGEIYNILKEIGIEPDSLYILGEMKTYRSDIKYKSSLISIDKSEYNSLEDYEIECEDISLDIASKNLQEFLNKNRIPFKKNTVSKYKRFINSI